ncbi:MAG: TlpA family protein disulfide reductase [Cyclobacteriaceae bacterium]|nr:TlpA family protein disulfide reductase [Cyclobacteriaceae bacterium]
MQKVIFLLLGLLLAPKPSQEPPVEVIKFDTLQHLMNRNSQQIEVINFWATWCKPCIKELPYFQSIHQQMGDKVNVTLISLDFADQLDSKVVPFVKKKGLTAKVLLLDEIDYNSWIDKVDPSWTGSIPATLVIDPQSGRRKFVEGELKQEELEEIIREFTK